MSKIYNTDHSKFIVYNRYKSKKKTELCVIFLHGLYSNMIGSKALFLENYCKNQKYNFIRFDNFGHGKSSGKFLEETIGSWLEGLELIINKFELKKILLIGSSMGGWVSLLAVKKYPDLIKGFIGIACAADFTHDSIWNKLPPIKQQQMQKEGWLEIRGTNCSDKYPISYNLIQEAKNHLLLHLEKIEIECPVHLIHGMQDIDIPYKYSLLLSEKITSKAIVVKLIKNADHRLSKIEDLKIIANSLEEIIALL